MGSSIRRHSATKHGVTKEVLRRLSRPLTVTLMDLRSSLVREACVLLEILAEMCGDRLRYLMRDIMGKILQVIGSTNSVIVDYVDSAFRYIIDKARFPREVVRKKRAKSILHHWGRGVLTNLLFFHPSQQSFRFQT